MASLANPYKFRVYRNAAYNFTSAYAKVPFDTKNYDTGTNFDVVTNNRFVAPVTGYYQFSAVAGYTSSSGSAILLLALFKNGVAYSIGSAAGTTGGYTSTRSSVSDLIPLTATDYVEVYANAVSGTIAMEVGGSTVNYFSGFFVSAT